ALMVFHYTITGINELREPLHDEVQSTVLRIEGDRLVPVEADFEQTVLHSEFHSLKSSSRLDNWLRTIRGHWFQHKTGLEELLRRRESEMRTVFEGRAKAALDRELEAAKESYRYRLKELQDRSREQEIDKLARQIAELAADTEQGVLFEEIRETS